MQEPYRVSDHSIPEVLIRKLQFFGDSSGLHGVGHVCSMSPISFFKRLFWLLILGMCAFSAGTLLQSALGLYYGDIVSFGVDTNYLKFDTPYPAITVCEGYLKKRTIAFLKSNNMSTSMESFIKEVFHWNINYCKTPCKFCDPKKNCLLDFQQYTSRIRANCSQLIANCTWNGEEFPCCKRFLPMPTEYGVCYSFNSRLASNDSTIMLNRKTRLPVLKFISPRPSPISIRIQGSNDAVSTFGNIFTRTHQLVYSGTHFRAFIEAEQTISDVSIRSLSRSLRGCLFRHEVPTFAHLWPFKTWPYSYNTCVLYCRALEQMQLCNCTHHFMPRLDGVPACDVPGMLCLSDNQATLVSVDCDCPMACEEVIYKPVHVFFEKAKSGEVRDTEVEIRFAHLPSIRVQRQTIRGTMGLVVDIGGLGGVFFGASLLSVIEIIYLLCIRSGP